MSGWNLYEIASHCERSAIWHGRVEPLTADAFDQDRGAFGVIVASQVCGLPSRLRYVGHICPRRAK